MNVETFIATLRNCGVEMTPENERTWRYVWDSRNNPQAFIGEPAKHLARWTDEDMKAAWEDGENDGSKHNTFEEWLTEYKQSKNVSND